MRAAVIAIALVLMLAAPATASERVPFKGSLSGTVAVTPIAPPIASVALNGSGIATQLGQFGLEMPHTVNQATRVGTGTFTFTAANGDTLTGTFSGQATLVSPGVLTVAESAVITGGTGRFHGATGSFSTERTFLVATLQTTGSFSGWISPPGRS